MKLSKAMEKACEALADPGVKPTRKARAARPPRKLAAGWAVELTLPVVVVSEMNRRDHWRVRHKRFAAQSATFRGLLYEGGFYKWEAPLPVVVTMTHVGRTMDDDNLAGAFKGLRDDVAAWLDLDDADDRVTWEYRQESPGTPGVRVRVSNRD